jgi:hypothetical protein
MCRWAGIDGNRLPATEKDVPSLDSICFVLAAFAGIASSAAPASPCDGFSGTHHLHTRRAKLEEDVSVVRR